MMTWSSVLPVCGVMDSVRSMSLSRFKRPGVNSKTQANINAGTRAYRQHDDDGARQPGRCIEIRKSVSRWFESVPGHHFQLVRSGHTWVSDYPDVRSIYIRA